jgi:hypothetical protein
MASFAPRPLYPRGKIPGTHWIRGWVGSRAGLDAVVRRRNSIPWWESNPSHPASPYSDWVTPARIKKFKVKVKLSLYLIKYHAMKTYTLLNWGPRHEEILRELGQNLLLYAACFARGSSVFLKDIYICINEYQVHRRTQNFVEYIWKIFIHQSRKHRYILDEHLEAKY